MTILARSAEPITLIAQSATASVGSVTMTAAKIAAAVSIQSRTSFATIAKGEGSTIGADSAAGTCASSDTSAGQL